MPCQTRFRQLFTAKIRGAPRSGFNNNGEISAASACGSRRRIVFTKRLSRNAAFKRKSKFQGRYFRPYPAFDPGAARTQASLHKLPCANGHGQAHRGDRGSLLPVPFQGAHANTRSENIGLLLKMSYGPRHGDHH